MVCSRQQKCDVFCPVKTELIKNKAYPARFTRLVFGMSQGAIILALTSFRWQQQGGTHQGLSNLEPSSSEFLHHMGSTCQRFLISGASHPRGPHPTWSSLILAVANTSRNGWLRLMVIRLSSWWWDCVILKILQTCDTSSSSFIPLLFIRL